MACLVDWFDVSRWGMLDFVCLTKGLGRCYLDEDDVCAGFGEGDGDGLADATRTACDEGSVALKRE